MTSTLVSVKVAIERGIQMVRVPARQILAVTTLSIPVTWIFIGFSWVTLLHFPIGIIVASVYASRMRPKWRLWAYEHVADIHQLQRAAELAELLPVGSHNSLRGWLTLQQRTELSKLLPLFDQDAGFIDDPDIPEETSIYKRSLTAGDSVLLVINSEGIRVDGEGIIPWPEIENERIANVGYVRRSRLWGNNQSAGSSRVFRFECGGKRFEFHMADVRISAWELDLLTYIYRGRWAERRSQSYEIPNHRIR